ncbi:beta-eliminating lyase-related protein, partial [Neisseria meningitidis]|uniref:beta-eliminating lyase-related protein n=1 Tax=Neisseria meningitidis TaxID=487 RepID=UPI0030EDEC2F
MATVGTCISCIVWPSRRTTFSRRLPTSTTLPVSRLAQVTNGAVMFIDLRSDTVTKPTEGMRKAIYNAEVGDECFGEDPSVRALEEFCANYFQKEAALFTTGGT